MSAISTYSSLPASRARSLFREPWQFATRTIRSWQRRASQRIELQMLSDVELRELSLTAADVHRETRKSFWRSVSLNR